MHIVEEKEFRLGEACSDRRGSSKYICIVVPSDMKGKVASQIPDYFVTNWNNTTIMKVFVAPVLSGIGWK